MEQCGPLLMFQPLGLPTHAEPSFVGDRRLPYD
jgi:hypothetical protein